MLQRKVDQTTIWKSAITVFITLLIDKEIAIFGKATA